MSPAYAEWAPQLVTSGFVQCVWRHANVATDGTSRVVPDGCMDVITDGTEVWVAGPDTGPQLAPLSPGHALVGVRFPPGVAPAVLGVPASALRDQRVPLPAIGEIGLPELAERLVSHPVEKRTTAIETAVVGQLRRVQAEPDPVAQAVVHRFVTDGSAPTRALADTIGISERQLHRRCVAAFGYGPSTLRRILRFQALLAAGRSHPEWDLGRLSFAVGYSDQAHMSHEVRRLSGLTPTVLRAEWMSDPYKTPERQDGMLVA